MGDIVKTTGLCKRYGDVLRVKDLDLAVEQEAVYGFLGPNGAGKSTTMKLILGLVHPTSGSVTVFGKPMTDRNRLDLLRFVGSLIESPSYYGHLSGKENLQVVCALKGVSEKEIDRVLSIVRLENQKNKKVTQYSMGMKQRLGLACALLGNPKLLILDEPTNGLDPAGMQEMRELIMSLPKQYGMTVMVSSHLLGEIDQIATHIGIINKGELVYQDQMTALHQQSRSNIALRTSDNRSAAAMMREKKIPVQVQNEFLVLPHLTDHAISELIPLLYSSNVAVVRIEEWRKSLEDIFLDLTGTAVSL